MIGNGINNSNGAKCSLFGLEQSYLADNHELIFEIYQMTEEEAVVKVECCPRVDEIHCNSGRVPNLYSTWNTLDLKSKSLTT